MISRENARARRFLTARFRDVLHLCSSGSRRRGDGAALCREHQKYTPLREIKHALMIYLIFIKSAALVPQD